MRLVSDLHSHSKYSRAVSSQMVLPVIENWCQIKGIDVVGTGDFTHPLWFKELQSQLEESGDGVYRLKKIANHRSSTTDKKVLFILSTEVEVLFSQRGKSRKIHLLVFAPNFAAVEKINKKLISLGKNLFSDGRPKMGMSAREMLEVALGADERCLVIPAHAWTPWFGIFGSMSGFDSLEECFGDLAKYIYGIETGLSSDPGMNWRVPELDSRSILSFSDAHSAPKLGRELTVFDLNEVSYEAIRKAIMGGGQDKIAYTIEFYPEEGKYHYTGHRNCGVSYSPEETQKLGVNCPKCRRPLTVGVMHRLQEVAHGMPNIQCQISNDEYGVRWVEDATGTRLPYVSIVPLLEILAESLGMLVSSQRVINEYRKLTETCENELSVLMKTKPEELERISGQKIREAVERVRSGNIEVSPGYDGVFGTVKIWPKEKVDGVEEVVKVEKAQMGLF